MTLRPIGTEYVVERPPDRWSTDPRGTRSTYRVVAHVEGRERPGAPARLYEEVRCIAMERLPYPDSIKIAEED